MDNIEINQEQNAAKQRIRQYQHQLKRLEKKKAYFEKRNSERRARNHRLITRGAAIESIAPAVKPLTEQEFYALMELILALPGANELIRRAVAAHEEKTGG